MKTTQSNIAGRVQDILRRVIGIPTTREIARGERLARRIIRAFGRPSKFSQRAKAARGR